MASSQAARLGPHPGSDLAGARLTLTRASASAAPMSGLAVEQDDPLPVREGLLLQRSVGVRGSGCRGWG